MIIIFLLLGVLLALGLAFFDDSKSEEENEYFPNLCVVCGKPAKNGCTVCSRHCEELDKLNIRYH